MTATDTASAPRGGDRFDAIEALLARYPRVDADELAELKTWFRKEASAFDVASMASKEAIQTPYRQFRADHIDRLRPIDVIKGLAFAAAIVGLLLAVFVIKA